MVRLKYYKIKNGYISSVASKDEEGAIGLPEGYINHDIIRDNAYKVNANGIVELSEKYLCKRNLDATDWKVIKHRDQIALGITPSLTDEQYQELLNNRQTWREKASD